MHSVLYIASIIEIFYLKTRCDQATDIVLYRAAIAAKNDSLMSITDMLTYYPRLTHWYIQPKVLLKLVDTLWQKRRTTTSTTLHAFPHIELLYQLKFTWENQENVHRQNLGIKIYVYAKIWCSIGDIFQFHDHIMNKQKKLRIHVMISKCILWFVLERHLNFTSRPVSIYLKSSLGLNILIFGY